MLDRINFCSDLVSTAINAIETNDQTSALANLNALKNVINGLKFGDQVTAKAIKQVAKNTGLDDIKALEALVLTGCTTFGRGHGLQRFAVCARTLATLSRLGERRSAQVGRNSASSGRRARHVRWCDARHAWHGAQFVQP